MMRAGEGNASKTILTWTLPHPSRQGQGGRGALAAQTHPCSDKRLLSLAQCCRSRLLPRQGRAGTRQAASVVEENGRRGHRADVARKRQFNNAYRVMDALHELGGVQGTLPETEVRVGPDPETVILEVARKQRADLIILGTNLHAGLDLVFLGPSVETVLDDAPCPVIIVNTSLGTPVSQTVPSVEEENASRVSAALA